MLAREGGAAGGSFAQVNANGRHGGATGDFHAIYLYAQPAVGDDRQYTPERQL
jgi:hypothetical protein